MDGCWLRDCIVWDMVYHHPERAWTYFGLCVVVLVVLAVIHAAFGGRR